MAERDYNRMTSAGACHCLCTVNHPNARGVCSGLRATTVSLESPITGRVTVAMCQACADSTLETERSTATAGSEGGER
jgi:hypothetical protein